MWQETNCFKCRFALPLHTYREATGCKLGEDKYFCPKRAHPLAHAYMQLRSEDPLSLSVEKNPQSPIWRSSPGTWDIQRRVTSPCLGSCPRPLLKRWGMEPSWSWIHRESLQGFHNPSGPDPDRAKEREKRRERARSNKRPCRSLFTSGQLVN